MPKSNFLTVPLWAIQGINVAHHNMHVPLHWQSMWASLTSAQTSSHVTRTYFSSMSANLSVWPVKSPVRLLTIEHWVTCITASQDKYDSSTLCAHVYGAEPTMCTQRRCQTYLGGLVDLSLDWVEWLGVLGTVVWVGLLARFADEVFMPRVRERHLSVNVNHQLALKHHDNGPDSMLLQRISCQFCTSTVSHPAKPCLVLPSAAIKCRAISTTPPLVALQQRCQVAPSYLCFLLLLLDVALDEKHGLLTQLGVSVQLSIQKSSSL